MAPSHGSYINQHVQLTAYGAGRQGGREAGREGKLLCEDLIDKKSEHV